MARSILYDFCIFILRLFGMMLCTKDLAMNLQEQLNMLDYQLFILLALKRCCFLCAWICLQVFGA